MRGWDSGQCELVTEGNVGNEGCGEYESNYLWVIDRVG